MTELELFEAAQERPPAERDVFLDEACAGNAPLRQRLAALLARHAPAENFQQQRGVDLTTGPSPRAAPLAGSVIAGRYKLLEQIGEGGMGSVWVADQTEPVRRRVALKLIKPGMDTRQVLSRFEAERQALALMDHPNIAKVFDGGMTDEGRPFFVMEYVKGLPITQYCDDARLTVAERLALFTQVCQAVQHAHQKGIIHRDLKPGNILIALYDGKPVPKVIDFGLAKALHQSLTERTLHTAHEMVLGTPLYMSPEQAELNNLDIDTRSDIYSLGVILYELLTGVTPLEKQRFKEAAWAEVLRVIKEEEPSKPSTKLSHSASLPSVAAQRQMEPKKLSALIKGDLDWIVMKALEKDRSRRYETANGFALDIQRYLADEPVSAGPPGAGYRLKKFVRRHKGQVIAVGLMLLALLWGMAGTTWQMIRATTAEAKTTEQLVLTRKAEEEARQAVDEFFVAVSESKLLSVPGLQPLRKELLESALEYYQKFLTHHGDDPALRGALGKTWFRVGLITNDIGAKPDALTAYQKARDMQEELLREQPNEAQRQSDLAETCWNMGELERWSGQYGPALRSYERSRELCEQLVRAYPDVPAHQNALAKSYAGQGDLHQFTDRSEEAVRAFGQACALGETLVGKHPDNAPFQRDLADSCRRLGEARLMVQQYAEALSSLQRARGLFDQLVQRKPPNPEDQYLRGWSYFKIAICRQELGDLPAAVLMCSQGRDILDKLVRENPTVTEYRNGLSSCCSVLGNVQRASGQLAESQASLQQACDEMEKIVRAHPTISVYQINLVRNYRALAQAHALQKQPTEAIRVYQKSREHLEKLVREYPAVPDYEYELAQSYWWLGEALAGAADSVQASRSFKQALDTLENVTHKNPDRASFHNLLAWKLVTCSAAPLRDGTRAVVAAKKAVELAPQLGNYWNTLGVAYYRSGDWKAAVAALEKSMALREGGNCEDFFFLAMAHWQLDQKGQARQWHTKAIEWMTKHNPDDEELSRFRDEAAELLEIDRDR